MPSAHHDVKIFGVIFFTVVLLFIILMVTHGHGPSRHFSSVHAEDQALPSRVMDTLAFIVLMVAAVLAVYEPRGVTPYGQRRGSQ